MHRVVAMRLVLPGLAEVRISTADEHVLALDSRHDAYVIPSTASYRHLHSQLDTQVYGTHVPVEEPSTASKPEVAGFWP
jgi:hypothetical protein